MHLVLANMVSSRACITSMIRLRFTIGYRREIDATYDYTEVLIWSFVENSIAIICACLPFFKHMLSATSLLVLGIGRKASVTHDTGTSGRQKINNGIYGKQFHGLDADYIAALEESDTVRGMALPMTDTPLSRRASEYSENITTKGSSPHTTETADSRDFITVQRQYDVV